MIWSSKQAVRALGKGLLLPLLAGHRNHWLSAQQQLEKQQNTIRAPPEMALATKQMVSQRHCEGLQQTHSLVLACRPVHLIVGREEIDMAIKFSKERPKRLGLFGVERRRWSGR